MPNRFEGDFCRLIRHRRQQLDLTQQEVASKIGVTSDCITLVELDTDVLTSIASPHWPMP